LGKKPLKQANTKVIFKKSDVLLCLNKLNVNKPDNLHPRILYEIRHEICYPLTEIFETSWKMSNIPLDWQRANIVAVYKKK